MARKHPRLVCRRCGRRARYLWQMGRLVGCRGCAQKAGVQVVYPAQAALGFAGRLPAVCVRKGVA